MSEQEDRNTDDSKQHRHHGKGLGISPTRLRDLFAWSVFTLGVVAAPAVPFLRPDGWEPWPYRQYYILGIFAIMALSFRLPSWSAIVLWGLYLLGLAWVS